MYKKLIKNDIQKNRLITGTITVFILLTALLTSLAAMLSVNLFSAIDNMINADTPCFFKTLGIKCLKKDESILHGRKAQENHTSFVMIL